MKKVFTVCLAVVALTALAMYSYGAGGPKTEPPPKAKTIAELAERYDSSRCIDCHE
ncbi:MAG: cytochrome C, partial [Desulfobacterales bacterium]|nr:cytochrome C [Desulfobacterales bacterium]